MIVLDPGHGGRDHGARGPSGATEKDICLALARELATLLEGAHFAVLLTRSDDYDVDLRNRTAIANHAKAAIFISIHTAAGFLHGAEGMTIYYGQPESSDPPSAGSDRLWQQQPATHTARSRELANILAPALKPVNGSSPVEIIQAPLAVLTGAEMPAVLIEIGYLTHAATEKKLGSRVHLNMLASAIARGITDHHSGLSMSAN